jgi:hypothetical protein
MDKVTISNLQGESGLVNVVRYFTNNGKEYLIYSLNEIDESGYTRLYVTKISGVDGLYNAETLDEIEWNEIKNIVKQIVRANKEGSQVPIQDLNPKKIQKLLLKDKKVFKLNASLVNDLGSNKPSFNDESTETGNGEQKSAFDVPSQPVFNTPIQPTFDAPIQQTFDMPVQPTFDVPTQPTFDVPTQPTFDVPTQPTFDVPTQPTFDVPTQPTFDVPTQPTFDVPTQPTFDVPTQPTFDVPTQPTFDVPTQPTFDVPTQPTFDVPTQPTSNTLNDLNRDKQIYDELKASNEQMKREINQLKEEIEQYRNIIANIKNIVEK